MYEDSFLLEKNCLLYIYGLMILVCYIIELDIMDKKLVMASSVALVSTGIAAWTLYKWLQARRILEKYTDVYCNQKEVNKQVFHHFGNLKNLPHLRRLIPTEAENYHLRLAKFCCEMCDKYQVRKDRVMDIGSGPGGAAFHLSSYFQEVVATDTSILMNLMVKVLKEFGHTESVFHSEGGKHIFPFKVSVPETALKERVTCWDEDVSCLYHTCGMFSCILASNTLTEMHDPKVFLEEIGQYVPAGGLLIIADAYNWRDGPEELLGGDGSCLTFSLLKKLLQAAWTFEEEQNMPFFVPSCARCAQLGNAHVTVWRRKNDDCS